MFRLQREKYEPCINRIRNMTLKIYMMIEHLVCRTLTSAFRTIFVFSDTSTSVAAVD